MNPAARDHPIRPEPTRTHHVAIKNIAARAGIDWAAAIFYLETKALKAILA